jgi:hypothetical protein
MTKPAQVLGGTRCSLTIRIGELDLLHLARLDGDLLGLRLDPLMPRSSSSGHRPPCIGRWAVPTQQELASPLLKLSSLFLHKPFGTFPGRPLR